MLAKFRFVRGKNLEWAEFFLDWLKSYVRFCCKGGSCVCDFCFCFVLE